MKAARRQEQRKTAVRAAVWAAALLLAGCASQEGLHTQVRPLDVKPLGVEAVPAGQDASAVLSEPAAFSRAEGAWWASLADPGLDALVQRALAEHPSVQTALARLGQAQALAAARGAADQPQLQLGVDAARQRYTANGLYPPPVAGSILTSGTVQLEGSWEADLFGRHAADLRAALGQAAAARADLAASRLLLSSQVARSYVQLARLIAQRDVAQRTLAQRQALLTLVRQRVDAGLDTSVELRQGEGALPETRQQIEALDEQVALARHQLATLTAQPPSATQMLAPSLQHLQARALPAELPLNLLARRADVMALHWRARAAGAQVDVARTLFYPNINIVAFAGFNAVGLDRLFKTGSDQFGVMPAIDLPLFDAGRRRANLQEKLAGEDVAVAAYNQAILDAVREVADHAGSGQSIERQRHEQAAAQSAAESAYDLALQRYRAGLGGYLSVLSAETAVLNQRRLAVDLQARALDTRIALAKALGGDWDAQAAPPALAGTSSSSSSGAASSSHAALSTPVKP